VRGVGAGRIVAWAGDKLHVSTDFGDTWDTTSAPPFEGYEGDVIAVSEAGFAAYPYARLGWGPTAELPAAVPSPAEPTVAFPAPPRGWGLTCEKGKPGKSPKLLDTVEQARAALAAAPDNHLESVDAWSLEGTRVRAYASVRTPAKAEPKADAKPPATPVAKPGATPAADAKAGTKGKLAFAWLDESQVPPKVRSASGALPADVVPPQATLVGATAPVSAPLRTALKLVAAAGDRAVFALDVAGKVWLGRTSGSSLELVAFPGKGFPRDASIANDGAVSWVGDDGVGYWPPKGAPRIVAKTRGGKIAVAAPTKEGIPLMVGEAAWAAVRVIPIPKEGDAPAWLDLDGWSPAPFVPSRLTLLPACDAKPKKGAPTARFGLQATSVGVRLPGSPATRASTVWIRANAAEACVESVVARLGGTPSSLVRADLAKKTFERAYVREPTDALTCRPE